MPIGLTTRANAHVINGAGYLQEHFSFLHGKLQAGGGIRYDQFRFDVADRVQPLTDGAWTADRLQRKANVAFTPLQRFPITFYGNYGRA